MQIEGNYSAPPWPLGGITRSTGGTTDFTATGLARVTTSTTNTNGILGGWATVNGMSNWAAINGGVIGNASETTTTGAGGWATNANVTDGSGGYSGTTASGAGINSLLFNGAQSSSIAVADTLTIQSGGILETAAVGNNASSINGGTLLPGSGEDLTVIQNNTAASLTIGSAIAGGEGLTKSGAGTLVLSGNNTYLGTTSINAGQVALSGASTLGLNTALTIANGAAANLSGSSAAQSFSTLAGNGALVTGSGGVSVGLGTGSSTFNGIISGTGSLTQNGNNTLTLTGENTYSGATIIDGGTVAVTGLGTVGNGSGVILTSGSTETAELDLSQATSAVSVGSLSGNGIVNMSSLGLTVGTDNTSTTFGGTLVGLSGLTKVGAGTFTFTGTNESVPNVPYAYNVMLFRLGETVDEGTLAFWITAPQPPTSCKRDRAAMAISFSEAAPLSSSPVPLTSRKASPAPR